MATPHSPKLSFVIPFMNEEATLDELYAENQRSRGARARPE